MKRPTFIFIKCILILISFAVVALAGVFTYKVPFNLTKEPEPFTPTQYPLQALYPNQTIEVIAAVCPKVQNNLPKNNVVYLEVCEINEGAMSPFTPEAKHIEFFPPYPPPEVDIDYARHKFTVSPVEIPPDDFDLSIIYKYKIYGGLKEDWHLLREDVFSTSIPTVLNWEDTWQRQNHPKVVGIKYNGTVTIMVRGKLFDINPTYTWRSGQININRGEAKLLSSFTIKNYGVFPKNNITYKRDNWWDKKR